MRNRYRLPAMVYTTAGVSSPQRVTLEDSAPKRPSLIKVGAQPDVTLYHQPYNVLLVRITRNSKPENRIPVSTVAYLPPAQCTSSAG
jgi:hypothetical protein